jgi:hypothetical protein
MGPVVALAYSTTILNRKMVRLAWANDLSVIWFVSLLELSMELVLVW